jgi:hypothetical protein
VSRVAAVALLAAVLAVPAAAEGSADDSVLALVSLGRTVDVVRLDPVSLEPAAGVPRVGVGDHAIPWAQSPDGSVLAVGSIDSTSLVFVDARSMRALGRIGTAFVRALAWPEPDRLLLFEHNGSRWRFALVDPLSRTVLWRRTVGDGHADLVSAARTRDGLAILMAPGRRVASPWLLLLDADGGARRISLPRIAAGSAKRRIGKRYRSWHRHPGLAVDAEGGRAFVVTAGPRVAVVELATLAVSYRDVRVVRARTAGGGAALRARDGGILLATGTLRQAHWLGNGLIATAGWDSVIVRDRRGQRAQGDAPAGVSVIDTRDWTSRRLVAEARWFHPTADLILARSRPRGRPGTVLAAFAHEGATRFRVELDDAAFGVQSAGPYAYLGLGDEYRPHRVTVIDTRTGSVAGSPVAPGWVLLLSPSQPQFCLCYTGTTVD